MPRIVCRVITGHRQHRSAYFQYLKQEWKIETRSIEEVIENKDDKKFTYQALFLDAASLIIEDLASGDNKGFQNETEI